MTLTTYPHLCFLSPYSPGQVNALGGPKDGPRQGPVTGVLADLEFGTDAVFKF